MAYEAGASSDQLMAMGDEHSMQAMHDYDPDSNFMDTDDLVNGVPLLDLDIESLGTATQQPFDDLNVETSAAQVQRSIEDPDDATDMRQDGGTTEGPGAGPLPASYGIQLPPNTGSTLTEFTKRRNWSQRVIEELKDFLHILTPDGRILYGSPSAQTVTGHDAGHLVGQFITDFIHPDDNAIFVREFNESIASGNPLRFFYRFRRPEGTYAILECHGHPHLSADVSSYNQDANAVCKGFFMMARPYPTKNAALLDSFLEHKIENERLKKRIADLKREEQEDLEEQQRLYQTRQNDGATGTPAHLAYDDARGSGVLSNSISNFDGMPPPAKPNPSNLALTRQNLNEALAASRPDSIGDKMARYEGSSHLETIEMLTGLQYRHGERSKGISTGAASPTLVRGDQGIAISLDRDRLGRSYSGSPYGDITADREKKKSGDGKDGTPNLKDGSAGAPSGQGQSQGLSQTQSQNIGSGQNQLGVQPVAPAPAKPSGAMLGSQGIAMPQSQTNQGLSSQMSTSPKQASLMQQNQQQSSQQQQQQFGAQGQQQSHMNRHQFQNVPQSMINQQGPTNGMATHPASGAQSAQGSQPRF